MSIKTPLSINTKPSQQIPGVLKTPRISRTPKIQRGTTPKGISSRKLILREATLKKTTPSQLVLRKATSREQKVNFCWLGSMDYQHVLDQQRLYVQKANQNGGAYIVGCEHPPTITLGKRASLKEEINCSLADLKHQKIAYFHTERGGLATLHSPGQLLIYPIVPLKKWHLSVRFFVTSLQHLTLECLSSLGLKPLFVKEDGIYSTAGKLVFMGFRIHQGVSYHGLAINVKNDLNLFHTIRVCGKAHAPLDSLQKHSIEIDLKSLFLQWNPFFLKTFSQNP